MKLEHLSPPPYGAELSSRFREINEQNILNDYEQGIEEIGCRLRLSSCERRCLSDDCPRLVA